MDDNKFMGAIERETYRGGTEVAIHTKIVGDPRAQCAQQFMDRWGMIAGVPEGEDSAGRSKVRLMTVEELVTRACESSNALFAELERRGWLLSIPAPKPERKDDKVKA